MSNIKFDGEPGTGPYQSADGVRWAVNGVDVFKACKWDDDNAIKDREHLNSGLCIMRGLYDIPELAFMTFTRGYSRGVTWLRAVNADRTDEIKRLTKEIEKLKQEVFQAHASGFI